jgi:penicillin-binding protein 1A
MHAATMSLSAESIRAWRLRARRRGKPSDATVLAATGTTLVAGLVIGAIGLALLTGPLASAVTKRMSEVGALAGSPPDVDARSKVYSRDGRLLAFLHGEENREPIALAKMPEHVRNAVIAIEDHRFYSHDGVDMTALGRALVVNSGSGQIQQGGGTITMQLARNAYLRNHARTILRKWDEIVLARRLERELTKDQILEQYLNSVYFGRGAYGIQAAAEAYFGIPASKLTLGQGALLAGVIRAPESYDPAARAEQALARRRSVLDAMVAYGLTDRASADGAAREPLKLVSRTTSNGIVVTAGVGAAFVEYVKQQLLADPRLGATPAERADRVFNGGLRIYTTLDFDAQRSSERAIASVLDRPDDPSAALAAIEPTTGAIRAMAGAVDPQGFNLAAHGRRQPGSAFKPFTLVAALEQDISLYKGYNGSAPRRITLDNGQVWTVHNYEGSASGYMNLITATERSVNAVYAQLVMDVGADNVVDVAHRMGITSHLDPYPSIALGGLTIGVSPLEMASAYGTLAAHGLAHRPYTITHVDDRAGRLLTVAPEENRAIDAETADKATAVLERVVQNGTGRRAQELGRPAAGKTGTTDDYRDSWFVGFTPQLSAAVWIGHPEARIPLLNIHGLPRVYGGSLPAEIWTRFMRGALEGEPVLGFPHVSLGSFQPPGGSPSPQPSDFPVWPRRRHGHGRR